MKTLSIGPFTIDKLIETSSSLVELDFLFPSSNLDNLEKEFSWLNPDFVTNDKKLILSFHSYIIRIGSKKILVDACVGNDKCRPNRPQWHLKKFPYIENLNSLGISKDEIDFVMCTHLHADHVGWNTQLKNGEWVPTFPNAKYIFSSKEFSYWESKSKIDSDINHGSFNDSILPIIKHNQALLVKSDFELNDFIKFEAAPGHTPGNIMINLKSKENKIILSGDIIHHPIQISYPNWSSRFCEDPEMSFYTREKLINNVVDKDIILLPAHFPNNTVGKIKSFKDKLRYVIYDY